MFDLVSNAKSLKEEVVVTFLFAVNVIGVIIVCVKLEVKQS